MPILISLMSCVLAALPFGLLYWLLALKPPVVSSNPNPDLNTKWFSPPKPRWRRLKTSPEPPARPCPATVVELAQAFVAGHDCGFALHDALLDAGFTDLAEDFRGSRFARQSSSIQAILDGNSM